MLTKKTIGFIGAGNLAEALMKGLLSSRAVGAGQISASDPDKEKLFHLAETYEIRVASENFEVARGSEIVFLTVKPQNIEEALRDAGPEMTPDKLLISVAAGIPTQRIFDMLGGSPGRHVPVIRAMPNTPALVGEGMTVLFPGGGATEADLAIARAVFEAVGRVVVVDDEALMNAVTGLSGSGPAYVFLMMEAMVEKGVNLGLPKKDAEMLAMQTTLGAARLALESTKDLAELRRMVTSPGGTTAEGLKALDEAGFTEAVASAIEAASKRSEELSGA